MFLRLDQIPTQLPWPVWLSWLVVILQTGKSPVCFRARAWVVGLVPGREACKRPPVSVSLILPPPLLNYKRKNLLTNTYIKKTTKYIYMYICAYIYLPTGGRGA